MVAGLVWEVVKVAVAFWRSATTMIFSLMLVGVLLVGVTLRVVGRVLIVVARG